MPNAVDSTSGVVRTSRVNGRSNVVNAFHHLPLTELGHSSTGCTCRLEARILATSRLSMLRERRLVQRPQLTQIVKRDFDLVERLRRTIVRVCILRGRDFVVQVATFNEHPAHRWAPSFSRRCCTLRQRRFPETAGFHRQDTTSISTRQTLPSTILWHRPPTHA